MWISPIALTLQTELAILLEFKTILWDAVVLWRPECIRTAVLCSHKNSHSDDHSKLIKLREDLTPDLAWVGKIIIILHMHWGFRCVTNGSKHSMCVSLVYWIIWIWWRRLQTFPSRTVQSLPLPLASQPSFNIHHNLLNTSSKSSSTLHFKNALFNKLLNSLTKWTLQSYASYRYEGPKRWGNLSKVTQGKVSSPGCLAPETCL